MLVENNFRIRAIDRADLKFLADLRNDETTSVNLGTFLFVSANSQEDWFLSVGKDPTKLFLIFEMRHSNEWESVGLVRLTDIDYVNRSVCVGGDIAPKFRGKGYAKFMYNLIFRLCFEYWNMNRLWLLVLEFNNVALSLYKKLGFIEEGVKRKAIFRNGKYHNYIMMSILQNERTENLS